MLDDHVRYYYIAAELISDLGMRIIATRNRGIIPGIGENVTVGVVLDALKQDGCFPFFYGGVVRDIFLNKANVADIDLEADCNVGDVLYRYLQWTLG